jgi:hypothetical protein
MDFAAVVQGQTAIPRQRVANAQVALRSGGPLAAARELVRPLRTGQGGASYAAIRMTPPNQGRFA